MNSRMKNKWSYREQFEGRVIGISAIDPRYYWVRNRKTGRPELVRSGEIFSKAKVELFK